MLLPCQSPGGPIDISAQIKTIAIDFDGVIHRNLTPWRGSASIDDIPVFGVRVAIAALRSACRVVVFSCRARSVEGRTAILAWLKQHKILVDDVTDVKPMAEVYLDDRSICFDGNWMRALRLIKSFQTYQFEEQSRLRRDRKMSPGRPWRAGTLANRCPKPAGRPPKRARRGVLGPSQAICSEGQGAQNLASFSDSYAPPQVDENDLREPEE